MQQTEELLAVRLDRVVTGATRKLLDREDVHEWHLPLPFPGPKPTRVLAATATLDTIISNRT